MTLKYKKYGVAEPPFALLGKAIIKDGEVRLPWSYGGISFAFRGRGVILEMGGHYDNECDYLRVEIDGAAVKYPVCGSAVRIVTPPAEEGEHTARVMRVTEGLQPLCIKSVTVAGEDPAVTGPVPRAKKDLMFIGDSITCGYGVDAPGDVPGFNTFEEDCTLTYAYMAARAIGAEILFTGASGKGIAANCMGNREDMTLIQAFEWEDRQGGEWDPAGYVPDAVVINAGTNDAWGGVTDEEFYAAGMALLAGVRKKFPHAPILWAYGIMDVTKLNCIKRITEDFDRKNGKTYFLDCGCMSAHGGEVGGGGHPNVNTSLRVYPLLAEKLKSIIGE